MRADTLAAMARHDGPADEAYFDALAEADRGVPPEPEWVREAPESITRRLGARPLSIIPTDPPPPLLVDRLDPEGHTILFGPGGVGKGTKAADWIVQLAQDGQRVLILDYENHPGEWARRIFGLGGADVMTAVTHVAPLAATWRGRRGPLWDQAAEIRALCLDLGATYVVIDSIIPACLGADPSKPDSPALYAGALELIGLPALSLAHVARAEDLRYPFGSVFWHNLARFTWAMKRDGESAILSNRKHNNYQDQGRYLVTTTWLGGRPVSVVERGYTLAVADRIAEALGDERLTVRDIVARLNEDLEDDAEPVKEDTVGRTLRRGLTTSPKRFAVSDNRWRRV